MTQNTSLKDNKAMSWWNELSSASKTRLVDINPELLTGSPRRWETLTGREIETIYLKEHQHIEWWNSKNYNTKKRLSQGYIHPTDSSVDPVMFLDDETIKEIYLKEHPTEAEVKTVINEDTQKGIFFAGNEMTDDEGNFPHIIAAEVIKEEETLSFAACKYEKMANDMSNSHRLSFSMGAMWQKQKDRELIEELLAALNSENWDEKTKSVITKAEQHLNNG